MKRKDWKARTSVERQYQSSLETIRQLLKRKAQKAKTIKALIDGFNQFAESKTFKDYANKLALNMVRAVSYQNAKTWREAAKASNRGYAIYKALNAEFGNNPKFQALINQNAELIKSIPKSSARTISNQAARFAIEGKRPEALLQAYQSELENLPGHRAETIARTEIAKTQASITEIRSKNLGIDWAQWETSGDQRTRPSHKNMQGVWFRYSDLPDAEVLNGEKSQFGHYAPGMCPNCRCFAAPLVDESQMTFPAKVYYQGRIVKLTRKQFEQIQ